MGLRIKTQLLFLIILFSGVSLFSFVEISEGYSSYGEDITGPLSGDCAVCHVGSEYSQVNPYGEDFRDVPDYESDTSGAIDAISDLDSDGDGEKNGDELDAGSYPGDPASLPPAAKPTAVISSPKDFGTYDLDSLLVLDGSNSTDENGDVVGIEYTWTLSTGEVYYGPTVSHTLDKEGSHTVELTILVGGQESSTTVEFIVKGAGVELPPIVMIDEEDYEKIPVGDTVSFSACRSFDPTVLSRGLESEDGDVCIVDKYGFEDALEFLWDFGDGSEAFGHEVDHRFEDPGNYNVTLTVTKRSSVDGSGNPLSSSVNLFVLVLEPELRVTFLGPSLESPNDDKPVVIMARVENIGEIVAKNLTVEFRIDDQPLGRPFTGVIIPTNDRQTFLVKEPLEEGNYEVSIQVSQNEMSIEDGGDIHVHGSNGHNSTPGFGGSLLIGSIILVSMLVGAKGPKGRKRT